jgi:hypothetical protein
LLFVLRTYIVDPLVWLLGGQEGLTWIAHTLLVPIFLLLEVLGGRGASMALRRATTLKDTHDKRG